MGRYPMVYSVTLECKGRAIEERPLGAKIECLGGSKGEDRVLEAGA